MSKATLGTLLVFLLGNATTPSVTARAQSFGGAFHPRKIVLVRKLPPTGHIDGSSFMVKVSGIGIPPDVVQGLQSTIESLLISNDSRLHTVAEHPDATITCQVTSFAQSQQTETENGVSFTNKAAPSRQFIHVKGMMTVTFNAQDVRSSKSIAADTVTAKFDQEYPVQSGPPSRIGAVAGMLSHIPNKSGAAAEEADKPPTPAELRDKGLKNISYQIVSRLVNTSEQVQVSLAVGGGLDDADKLMDQKLWTRALEQLETMTPFPQPDQDAYRIYDLGVVNEALGYQAEDVTKARKFLQEASIDYGKAIDAKPSEKGFLEPQTRIDTALAHYKTLGERSAASEQKASAAAVSPPAAEALSNADVIAMVSAKLDEANIIDTIRTSGAVNFDLSAKGQIDLAKGNVNGRIIAAMKQKARGQ
jgi:hypothetical protein